MEDKSTCEPHENIDILEEYELCLKCGQCKPKKQELRVPLRPIHYIILDDIRRNYPQHFFQNRTSFLISQIFEYVYQKKVFRLTEMGETRGGKSELAQTIALIYIIIFNALYKKGHFKNLKKELEKEQIKFNPLSMITENIHANQSAYLYHLRDKTRENLLLFGQMHIIDEDRENVGGIGTFSEEMEVENLNNIVAKFCQCEIWITPKRFQIMNTPYGINVLIKDEQNTMNWALLYKIEPGSAGMREQNFLGWIGIKLHKDKKLRDTYNAKKNTWVKQELEGTINERAKRRMIAVNYFLTDDTFMQHTYGKDGSVKYHHGVETMKFLVETAMIDNKIDQFNDTEIERIVYGVRALGEKKYRGNQ